VTSSIRIVSASPSHETLLGPIDNEFASRSTLLRGRSVIAQRFV
jgi:hypothetical protein